MVVVYDEMGETKKRAGFNFRPSPLPQPTHHTGQAVSDNNKNNKREFIYNCIVVAAVIIIFEQ